MLAGALKFRIEFGVQEVRAKGEEGLCKEEGFQLQYDKGKAYIHGTDKKDRPVVFIHVAKHNPKEQSQKSLERCARPSPSRRQERSRKSRFTIFNMETSRALIAPPVSQGTLVFDMSVVVFSRRLEATESSRQDQLWSLQHGLGLRLVHRQVL